MKNIAYLLTLLVTLAYAAGCRTADQQAAETEGELKPSQEETKQAGWYSKDELKQLAKKAEDYLAGTIKEDEWQNQPGLEPVWYDWFKELKII